MNSSIQDTDVTGTALKTISMRLRNTAGALQEMGEDSDGAAESITKLQQQLLGLTNNKVNIMLDENTFKSTYQIVKELSSVWGDLSDKAQADITRLVSGVRQGNAFSSLMTNFADGQNAVTTSLNSQNSAMEENQKYLDSISGRLSILKANFQEVSKTLINSDMIKGIVDLGSKLLSIVNIGDGALIKIPLMITGLTLLIGLLKTLGTTLVFTNMKASFVGLTAIVQSLVQQFSFAITAQTGFTATTISASFAQLGFAGSLKAVGVALKSLMLSNPVGWIILITGAIYGISKAVEHFHVTLEEQREITQKLQEDYEEIKNKLEDVNSELKTAQDRINELNNKDSLTFVEKDELQKLKDANEELERRQRILEATTKIKSQEAMNSLEKEYDKDFNDNEEYLYGNKIKGKNLFSRNLSKIKIQLKTENYLNPNLNSDNYSNEQNEIDEVIQKYKTLQELKQKPEQDLNFFDKLRLKNEDAYIEKINLYLKKQQDYLDRANELNIDNDFTDNIKNIIKETDSLLNPELYKNNIFEETFKAISNETPKVISEIQKLAQEGKLTADVLKNNYSDVFSQNYQLMILLNSLMPLILKLQMEILKSMWHYQWKKRLKILMIYNLNMKV